MENLNIVATQLKNMAKPCRVVCFYSMDSADYISQPGMEIINLDRVHDKYHSMPVNVADRNYYKLVWNNLQY